MRIHCCLRSISPGRVGVARNIIHFALTVSVCAHRFAQQRPYRNIASSIAIRCVHRHVQCAQSCKCFAIVVCGVASTRIEISQVRPVMRLMIGCSGFTNLVMRMHRCLNDAVLIVSSWCILLCVNCAPSCKCFAIALR